MSRKTTLINTVNQHLKYNNQGAYKQRQLRYFVLHKIIEDFYRLRTIPATWYALSTAHVIQLVAFWKKSGLQNATIMNYLVCFRAFLKTIEHPINGIDNASLQLTKSRVNKKPIIDRNAVLTQLNDPIAAIQFALQSHFGLTRFEAIQLVPNIHIKEDSLLITREISSNSKDRVIPIQSAIQKEIIASIRAHITASKNLKECLGETHLKLVYHYALKQAGLSTGIQYRYLYANARLQELNEFPKKLAINMIKEEMSITAASTFWSYRHE